MRRTVIVLAGIGLGTATLAGAQSAQNTPEAIICAMTGSCDGAAQPSAKGRVRVGDEKAFSLARAGSAEPSGKAAKTARPHRRATARRIVRPARVRPGGGIDMLVTFGRNSAEMTPQARSEARSFAQAMAAPQLSGMRFAIEGHTDATGTRDRNVALSQARAQSVVDYLVQQGIDSSRLTARGYGPDRPIQGSSAFAPANRRVEFVKQS